MISRFLDFFRYPSHSRTMGILAFLVVLLAIPLTVNIAQKQQELRQRAAGIEEEGSTGGSNATTNCTTDTYVACLAQGDDPSTQLAPTCTRNPSKDDSSCPGLAGKTQAYDCTRQSCTIVSLPSSATAPTPNPDAQCYPVWSLEISRRNCTPYNGPSNCGFPGTAAYLCADTVPSAPSGGGTTNTCTANGNDCVATPDACDRIGGTPGTGTCSPGGPQICCKGKTVFSDADAVCVSTLGGYCFNGTCSDDNATNIGSCTRGISCCKKNPGAQTCNLFDPGTWTYACNTADCPSGTHKAIKTCTAGGSQTDPTCYAGTDFDANGTHYVGCIPQTGIPGGGAPGGTGGTGGGPTNCSTSSSAGWNYLCDCTSTDNGKNEPGHHAVCSTNPSQDTHCYSNVTDPVAQCPVTGGTTQPGGGTGGTECTVINESKSGACQVTQNTCTNSSSGTRTVVKDSGSAGCKFVTLNGQPCLPGTVINSCTPGNQCPTSGTGACVAKPPASGGIQLAFTVGLDGLGDVGDFKTHQQTSTLANSNPTHKSRTLYFQVFDPTLTTEKTNGNTQVIYDAATKRFKGQAPLGQTVAAGTYSLKVRVAGYLPKILRNVTIGTDTVQLSAKLYTGYINEVNQKFAISTEDYNIFLSCSIFSTDNHALCNQNPQWIVNSDLDDNGRIDEKDYNLLLREFLAPSNEDQN